MEGVYFNIFLSFMRFNFPQACTRILQLVEVLALGWWFRFRNRLELRSDKDKVLSTLEELLTRLLSKL